MKIVILNGLRTEKYLQVTQDIENYYKSKEYLVETIDLANADINYCTGCWSCWFKSPGLCCHKDDTGFILSKVIQSDMLIHLTENVMGFTTSLSKKILDKFIPLIHPTMELVQGEFHHVKRYDKYPKLGLIYIDESKNTKDFDITKAIFKRAALNFKTELTLAVQLSNDRKDINYENFNI